MCSRYNLTTPSEAVRAFFRYRNEARFPPRFNIAPTQPVAIVRNSQNGERELTLVRWGLIPSWVQDPREFPLLINARAETAAEKPAFRAALRHRRCLFPANGFYEWAGRARDRRPHLVRPRQGGPMAMAGLYEHWMGADGSEIETAVILTVPANTAISVLHDRMPAILPEAAFEAWLDCRSGSAKDVLPLLIPAPDDLLEVMEVSKELNDPKNDGPHVLEPMRRTLL